MQLSVNFVNALAERECWQVASEYGEPGYGDGMPIIGYFWVKDEQGKLRSFFDKYPRILRQLEEQGYELEWYDEWNVDDNGKAWRCQPDSYTWMPSTVWWEDELLTPDDDLSLWLAWAVNTPNVCINDRQVHNIEQKLEGAGWTRQPQTGEYANGWHPGQTDDPKKIDADLRAQGATDVVFVLTGVGQFDLHFVAYYR